MVNTWYFQENMVKWRATGQAHVRALLRRALTEGYGGSAPGHPGGALTSAPSTHASSSITGASHM